MKLYANQKQTKPQAQTASQSNCNELYKYLDEDMRLLARILNQMWTEESYPDELPTQKLFLLIKKSNPELPEHYRPISLLILLNSSYKILTKIMQKRIADASDQFVSDTQFGFRRGKSTSEPLFSSACANYKTLQEPDAKTSY